MQTFTLTLSEPTINAALAALGEQPGKLSYNPINEIMAALGAAKEAQAGKQAAYERDQHERLHEVNAPRNQAMQGDLIDHQEAYNRQHGLERG